MAPRNNSKAARRNLQAVADITASAPGFLLPTQYIARVEHAVGNYIYSLKSATGADIMAELPSKFRSTIWIRRGGYVLVDRQSFLERDNKIDGEIINIVRHIKDWRKMDYWPTQFALAPRNEYDLQGDEEDDEDDDIHSRAGRMPPDSGETDGF